MESKCPVICGCHQPVHYARGCTVNVNQQAPIAVGGIGTWTNSGLNIQGMQDISVNNVLSYFVLEYVFDSPVSFLVDTGAGMSDP